MHFKVNNVNYAFKRIVSWIAYPSSDFPLLTTTSRVGEVIQITEPVIITYANPKERVLFNQARDANPFMNVMESLWMLQGRNDIEPITYYSKNYPNFVQDGDSPYANGAYGSRWRNVYSYTENRVDQLPIIIRHLKNNLGSRRAVLSMYNVEDDLLKMDTTKDICCNLSCTFQVIEGKLDMTVFNRSNDLILGALGANVVHFSFLQEYMAAHIGVPVGKYNQISTNLHVYTNNWKPYEWLADTTLEYSPSTLKVPLVKNPTQFDKELADFNTKWLGKDLTKVAPFIYEGHEPFFELVAFPMAIAFHHYKQKDFDQAMRWADRIVADDWRFVTEQWLLKRKKNYESRNPYLANALGRIENAKDS